MGGPVSGTFANIEGQTFNNGTEMWDVSYASNEVVFDSGAEYRCPSRRLLRSRGLG
jgi:hypothetical protein